MKVGVFFRDFVCTVPCKVRIASYCLEAVDIGIERVEVGIGTSRIYRTKIV